MGAAGLIWLNSEFQLVNKEDHFPCKCYFKYVDGEIRVKCVAKGDASPH